MDTYPAQDSPFVHLFETNKIPSADEVTHITQLLSEPVEELHRLNDEITRLNDAIARLLSRLDGLRPKRDEVQEYVDVHRALLTPVRRLPSDILGEIFVQCLPTDRNSTRSLAEAPLLLGIICRSWRDISLSTPRLWTAIHVYIPYAHTSKYQSLSDLVETRTHGIQRWLGRSGALPVSISLKIDLHDSVDSLEGLARALVRLSPRWGRLDLRVPDSFLMLLQQSLKPDDLPLLRDFRADLHDSLSPDHDAESLLQGFLAAPKLDNVSIAYFLYPARALLSPLSMTSLTSLSVQNSMQPWLSFTTNEVIAILLQCKLLRAVTLSMKMEHTRADDTARIDLPNLVDLRLKMMLAHNDPIAYIFNGSYRVFFARLHTPALKNLVLSADTEVDDDSSWVHLPFLPLLSGRECRLDTLDINFPSSTEALVECLRLVPRLKSLSIRSLPGHPLTASTDLLPYFPTDASPIPLCPSLENFFLDVMPRDRPGPSDEAILTFAQARWLPAQPGISKLKIFHAYLNRPMITDIKPQVRIIQEEGMDLIVSHKTIEHRSEFHDPADEGAYPPELRY